MSENQNQINQPMEVVEAEDLKKILYRYLRFWPVFILSAILFLAGAFIFLRYTPNVYQTSGKIKILKEQSGLDMSSLQGGSTIFDFSKVNLGNESEIIKSRRIAEKIIKNLNLQTEFHSQGTIKKFLIWGDEIPFEVIWNLDKNQRTPGFELKVIDQNQFLLEVSDTDNDFKSKFQFGELITYEDYSFRILVKENRVLENNPDNIYIFSHITLDNSISKLSRKVNVEVVGETSEILEVSMNGQNKTLNEAIINNLIYQFNNDGVEDNRKIAEQTEDFASERLEFLYQELDTVDSNLVDFKSGSNIVTIESTATELFAKNAQAEEESFKIANQILLVEGLQKLLDNMDDFSLLPANIGVTDGEVNGVIAKYNELITTRDRILLSSPENSIVIQEINNKLKNLKQSIIRSVDAYREGLDMSKERLDQKEKETQSSIGVLPQKEKRIREITRQQLIKERLYLFLLQKREEAALSAAIVGDISKVVDYAYTQPDPISPKPKVVYLGSLFVALLLPFSALYFKYLINTKINEKSEIRSVLPNIPIAGEIPLVPKDEDKLVGKNSNNTLSEGFRILRTNLNFMGLDKETSKVILVTSTIKGEGKTFVSVNLAATLSMGGAKCLLVGGDLRNPQIHNSINENKKRTGLSKFLYDKTTKIEDLIIDKPLKNFNLDIILSGEIPPNPTDLLVNDRFGMFLEEAKKRYDYIVVDTAPTLLVTDTLLISRFADITLYSIRANYTNFELLDHLKEVKNGKKLKNIGIVLNGVVNARGYAYNYGYGYGYNADKVKKRSRLKLW